MTPPTLSRVQSSDIGADPQLLDSRLRRLTEEQYSQYTHGQLDPADLKHGNGSSEKVDLEDGPDDIVATSGWPSGATTPWNATGTHTPNPTQTHPRMPSIRQSSMIEIKREQKRKWYAARGVKITTKYFYQEIDSSWTAVLIVACFFVSGLVDSVAFGVWSTFVGMQTGNTIFLALRISNQPAIHHPLNYLKSLTSVGSYCLGALAFNCLHRAPTGITEPSAPLHRWTLLTSFMIQSMLLTIAAILAQTYIISTEAYSGGFSSGSALRPGDNYVDLLGIGLLAFEAAGQVCLSRVLLINELPTIVLSTLYHDLIGEALSVGRCWQQSKTKWDFAVSQKKQIRRLASIISLFAGALVGGFVFRSKGGLPAALWVAAGTKIGICVAWCLWKKKVITETVVTKERSRAQTATVR